MEYMTMLTEKSVKPSHIRIKVLEYLDKNRIHPTADEIYEGLEKEIPTLSKTSVYNTVKLFRQAGLIAELTIEEDKLRYDFNTAFHGHFKCERCGKVYDVPEKDSDNENLKGFLVKEKNVYYSGVCKGCLGDNK